MSDSRSWKEREAAAKLAAAQAEGAKAAAEAQRTQTAAEAAAAEVELEGAKAAAGTKKLREQLAQTRIQQQIAEVEEAGKESVDQVKERRREQRAEAGVTFKRLVLVFVVICMAAALPAQISFFAGLHKAGQSGVAWLMTPLPLVLELAAWVSVAGTSWARRKGLPLLPFWLLTGALSSFAAAVNYGHGSEQYGLIAGAALAAASLGGPGMWELREALDARAAVDGRSREQRTADKVAAAKEKAAALAKAEHDARRAKEFAAVWKRFEQIVIAHPLGSLDEETAWRQAWWDVNRAPLGMTATTYALRVRADRALESVMQEERPVYKDLDNWLGDVLRTAAEDGEEGGGALAPTASPKPPKAPSEAVKTQGGKGLRALSGGRKERVQKPLSNEHLEAVRQFAALIAESGQTISTRMVRDVIGGGESDYISRLTRAIKDERGEK